MCARAYPLGTPERAGTPHAARVSKYKQGDVAEMRAMLVSPGFCQIGRIRHGTFIKNVFVQCLYVCVCVCARARARACIYTYIVCVCV